jgi:hypothetical protein
MHYGWKCGKALSNLWFKLEVNFETFYFLFNICAILEVLGYVEEGYVCGGVFFPFLKPYFKKEFYKSSFFGFLASMSWLIRPLNSNFKLVLFLRSSTLIVTCNLNTFPFLHNWKIIFSL